MPAFPYQRITNIGGRLGSGRQMPPDVFFELTPEQIVQALVNQGYSQKEAKKEVEQFMVWKEKNVVHQTFSDDETDKPAPPQEYTGFAGAVARIKGSRLTEDDVAG